MVLSSEELLRPVAVDFPIILQFHPQTLHDTGIYIYIIYTWTIQWKPIGSVG